MMNKLAARRLEKTIERGHWARFDSAVAAKNAIPQTAEEVEQSRRYLRAAFGLKERT